MEALRTSYKCLVLSLVLSLLIGFFTWAPTPVVNAGEEFAAVGGACDCSGTTRETCDGCRTQSYQQCVTDPPDLSTCAKKGTNCTASSCTQQRDYETCE